MAMVPTKVQRWSIVRASAPLRRGLAGTASTQRRVQCLAKEGGGGVDAPVKPNFDISQLNRMIKKQPPLYRVLLHNDNMNKREYVVRTLLKVVVDLTMEDAVNVMHEAHLKDVALVTVTAQETAEEYVTGLRRNGLTSTLEPQSGGSESEG